MIGAAHMPLSVDRPAVRTPFSSPSTEGSRLKDTLARRAYDELRVRLARGDLPPGTRLVNRALAEELGTSFTPVREAINQLASEGLVEYVRGGGAYVRTLSRVELAQLYDLRENLEPFAAAEAAIHITQHELDELDHLLAEWRELIDEIAVNERAAATTEQASRWGANEERFHIALVRAARNRWLTKIVSDLLLVASAFAPVRTQPDLLTSEAAESTHRGHGRLVALLRARDSDGAREWMLEHIRIGRQYVLDYTKRNRDQAISSNEETT